MSQLLFDKPHARRMNLHRHESRDVASLTIDVDRVDGRVTAKPDSKLKRSAEFVRSTLAESSAVDAIVPAGWAAATLTELCDHAEYIDHAHLRSELAKLSGLIAAVVAAYGDSHRHIVEIYRIYPEFCRQMHTHMFKEEYLFFSDIRRIEQTEMKPFCGSGILSGMTRVMTREHHCMSRTLQRIRALARDYEVPTNVNNNYRDMLDGLRNLEAYVLQHMQNEEDILFARAIDLENALTE